jgi:hypothetical protein
VETYLYNAAVRWIASMFLQPAAALSRLKVEADFTLTIIAGTVEPVGNHCGKKS